MMSQGAFTFYYWLTFIWSAIGFLFIAVAAIREVVIQFKKLKEKNLGNDLNSDANTGVE